MTDVPTDAFWKENLKPSDALRPGPKHPDLLDAGEPEPRLTDVGHCSPALEQTWLWDGMIPAGNTITLMAGAGSSGKMSTVLLYAAAVADKLPDLGGAAIPAGTRRPVIITLNDRSDACFQELALLRGAGEWRNGLFLPCFHWFKESELQSANLWDRIAQMRKMAPTRLMIFCVAETVFGINAISNKQVLDVHRRLRRMGGPWLITHHLNRNPGLKPPTAKMVRGAVQWTTGIDRLILLQSTGKDIVLRASRHGDPAVAKITLK